jgi:hypothetical protein
MVRASISQTVGLGSSWNSCVRSFDHFHCGYPRTVRWAKTAKLEAHLAQFSCLLAEHSIQGLRVILCQRWNRPNEMGVVFESEPTSV